jgi:rubrerythrin
MYFETEEEVLRWFESEPRALTPEFLASIPWEDVKKTPLDARLVPVIRYMRDIETFVPLYYAELMASPTGKDPHIRKFMERWAEEEPTHGLLLDRFLKEAGADSDPQWKEHAFANIPFVCKINRQVKWLASHLIGKPFCAVHMTWGAINEQTTLIGYKRLWETAKHPVLEHILRGIVREEARHALFYWSMARVKLLKYPVGKKIARALIDRLWAPVGEGEKPKDEADYVIAMLFKGEEGIRFAHRHVTERIAQLPGFDGLMKITDRIAEAAMRGCLPTTTERAA